MNYQEAVNQKSDMIIYTPEDGLAKIETTFESDTVWLSKAQRAELFQRDRSVISKHIKNVFEVGELPRESNVQILHIAQAVDKATGEYRKYKERTLSEVEQDYLDSIKMLEQRAEKK